MKAKKLTKKLSLRKETVSNLDDSLMKAAKGGIYTIHDTCGNECDTIFTCGVETICECDTDILCG